MNLCRLRTFPTSRDVRLESGLRPKADFRRPLRVYVRALSATPWEMTGWILAFLGHVDRILEALHGKECERGRRDHRPANWRRAQALFEPKPTARRHDFLQANSRRFAQSSPRHENIPLNPSGKSELQAPSSCPAQRGVGHRHERWGGLRWTRQRRSARCVCRAGDPVSEYSAQDDDACCVRQNRVVLAPVAGVKLPEANSSLPGSIKPSIRQRR